MDPGDVRDPGELVSSRLGSLARPMLISFRVSLRVSFKGKGPEGSD